ncbi:hypothetical protein ACPF04_05860 [Campylobacter sp. MOP51]|uniref:hypothetical protein n=1 Tax=Campylobacter canis TaxID=3378588 RepID=UPI003C570E96
MQRKCSSYLWVEELDSDKIYLKTNDGDYANTSFTLPLDFVCATDEEFDLMLVNLKEDLAKAYEKIRSDKERLEQENRDLVNSEDYKEYLRLKAKFEK